jgi:hypothetical protein
VSARDVLNCPCNHSTNTMAKNGVLQLKKLLITFCDLAGSSQGVRYVRVDPLILILFLLYCNNNYCYCAN